MGINIHAGVSYLYSRHHSYKDFEGRSCLMLGVQTIDSDGFEFFKAAGRLGFELMPDVYKLTRREMMRDFDSYKFFRWLGFSEVKALDYSDYEGAELLADLNLSLGSSITERFDLVYNGGTLEHVYDVPQAMKNIGTLLKDDGLVIHDAPAENWSDHGFYMFSPTFFDDYYRVNGYSLEELYFFNHIEGNKDSEYRSLDCRLTKPHAFFANKMSIENEVSLLVCTARKSLGSTDGKIPIQGFYAEVYADKDKLKQTAGMVKEIYKKVAIYGTGDNARGLYDLIKEEVQSVVMVKGKSNNTVPSRYVVSDFKAVVSEVECIVIGSFTYADVIENRIKDECIKRGVRLINMLDV